MKNFIYSIMILLFSVGVLFSQEELKLPPPINNEFLNACEGIWKSEPYNFFGLQWTDEISLKWTLNGQYMILNGQSKSETGFSFNSMTILFVDKDGNVKSWGFDDWGGDVAYFEGKIVGSVMTMEGGTKYIKGKYTLELNGNIMYQRGDFIFIDSETGKETKETLDLIYKKL